MHFIIAIQKYQLTIAQTYRLRIVIIDKGVDEFRPVLFFYQLFILRMWFYHIAVEVFDDKFKQLYPFKSKLEMGIDFSNYLEVKLGWVGIIVVLEKTLKMILYKFQKDGL